MRQMILAAFVLFSLAVDATAQCDCGFPEYRPRPCRKCIEKHVYVPVEPEGEPEAAPEGGYAAPPRTGEIAGESGSIGIPGPTIEFPRLSVSLPSIRFRGLTRYRRRAEFNIEAARAPFVREVRDEYSIEAGVPESAPEEEKEPEAGEEKPPCDKQPVPCPCPRCAQHSTTAIDSVAAIEARYNQRLRELQELESMLDQRMQHVAHALDRHEAAGAQQAIAQRTSGRQSAGMLPAVMGRNGRGIERASSTTAGPQLRYPPSVARNPFNDPRLADGARFEASSSVRSAAYYAAEGGNAKMAPRNSQHSPQRASHARQPSGSLSRIKQVFGRFGRKHQQVRR